MPPVETCPGRTAICEKKCYATRGNYAFPSVREAMRNALELYRSGDMVKTLNAEVAMFRPRAVRVHAAGDFFESDYVKQWIKIVRRNPGTLFYAYTRSWRVPDLRPALTALAALPNFRMWLSADKDSGKPDGVSPSRVAYMAATVADVPDYTVDLVFRVARKTKEKFTANGDLVCPAEQGSKKKLDCSRCGLCFDDKPIPKASSLRIPLVVLPSSSDGLSQPFEEDSGLDLFDRHGSLVAEQFFHNPHVPWG